MSTITGEPAPVPVPPRRSRSWLIVLMCLLIFCFGGVVGAGILVIHVGRQAKDALDHPDLLPERAARRLKQRLDLSDDQERQVQEIVRKHYPVIQQARENFIQVIDPELDAIETEIAALLAPDRARRFQERFEIFRDEMLPRRLGARRLGR
jgi:uncharacterized membrane protein